MKKLFRKLSLLLMITIIVVLTMGATPVLFKGLGIWRVEAKSKLVEEENIAEKDNTTEPIVEQTPDSQEKEETTTEPPVNKTEDATNKVEKVAYLTFDDGPTPGVTSGILDILSENKIKATFFVIGNLVEEYPQIALRAHDEGHLISNHTYSHNYNYIYANPENFMEDLMKGEAVLKSLLSYEYASRIIRFPGGSFGEGKRVFRETVIENGFNYIDWNALNGDAEAAYVSVEKQLQRIIQTTKGKNEVIVLLHDSGGKKTTLEALPLIIKHLQNEGYVFKTLAEYQL